jgi:hypothetical protein
MSDNPFVGSWTYRSFVNDPNQFFGTIGAALANPDQLEKAPKQCVALLQQLFGLVFGYGTITIVDAPTSLLKGTIGGEGWSLELTGSRSYGNPMEIRFQGKGQISGAEWIYDYIGYLVPQWPNGIEQRPAIVGSIVRTIPHPNGAGGTSPAGVVCSWYAVRSD